MEEAIHGGIVGIQFTRYDLSILECYNTGNISGNSEMGGIVGYQETGIIENCYNTGNIKSNSGNIYNKLSGISGQAKGNLIRNCYNAGVLEGDKGYKSAIAYLDSSSFEFSNYYLLNCGAQYPNSRYEEWGVENDGVSVGVTEEELRNLAQSLGENFTEDVDNINNGYPILKWQLNK